MVTKRIEIIAIGDEVLRGETRENNAAWLGRALSRAGLEVSRETELPDDLDVIARELREAAGRSDVVIVTGGLGPTVDDLTKEAAIRAFGLETAYRDEIVREIEARLGERGRTMPEGYRDQGRIPVASTVIPNAVGLAIGFDIPAGGAHIVLLPGVPAEMRDMFTTSVLPALGAPGEDFAVRVRTFGLTESEGEERLRTVIPENALRGISIISSPKGVDYYFTKGREDAYVDAARRALGSHVYAIGDEGLEEVVVRTLVECGRTLAVAESLTGGMLASAIVSVSGASATFLEGFVTYRNESKIARLGVAPQTLERHGAVSLETCVEMARGARERAGADYALSTTGIAGPTGATPAKPVGLCFVGCAGPEGAYARRLLVFGDREMVRLRAAYFAIDLLRLALAGDRERLAPFAAGSAY